MYDIAIIGAGPAGLTAALYALRADKSVIVLEKGAFGGQITFSPKLENYPGTGTLSGNRMLGLEDEERFVGNGISFCAVCDGAFYKDREVAVIGGGNSALQEALLLSTLCKKVTVVQNLASFTGEERLVRDLEKRDNVEAILSTVVTKFSGDDELSSIDIKNTETGEEKTLSVDGVCVAIGLSPQNEPFAEYVELNAYGYADSDESCTTKTDGLFVAGDCRAKKVRQVATAVGDGAVAALNACNYIDENF